MNTVLDDFKQTFLRQPLVDFLIALLVTSKLSGTIDSFLEDVISPILFSFFKSYDTSKFYLMINGSNIQFQKVITNIVSFLLSITIVFFFIIKPLRSLIEEQEQKQLKEDKNKKASIVDKNLEILDSVKNIELMLTHSSHSLRL